MEPAVEFVVLHPAILIVSGYECLSTQDVRFLNTHRKFFDTATFKSEETLLLTPTDFGISQILNPTNQFIDGESAFYECMNEISNFPYLRMRDVRKLFYAANLKRIFQEMTEELLFDLDKWLLHIKRPRSFLIPIPQVIRLLQPSPIYHKISALHKCGLGEKLSDAFGYVFGLMQEENSRD